jgi:biotin carboxyl carrier protein
MTLQIEAGDRVRTVVVHRKGPRIHVVLDGTTHVVDARRVGESTISMLVGARSIDASLAAQGAAGAFDVHVDGRVVPIQIRQAGAFSRQKPEAASQGTGPQKIVAPMPGKIVRVLVKPHDEVKARQGLVVIEAMKMENELRAARDGRVREVLVAEGQSVDAGTALMVVD